MIRIAAEHFGLMLAHAESALPNEACGLIAGREIDGVRHVEEVYPLTNIDASPEHFSMDPREQLVAVKDIRVKGLSLFGNFHSHPATPSRPSFEDIRLARDPFASYLILSLSDRTSPVLNSFRVVGDTATKEDLEIYP